VDWQAQHDASRAASQATLAFVVCDGLSALAVERHAAALLREVLPVLATQERWALAPVAIVEQGRVAIGDEIGELLGATLAVVLIGERPGLSSPDSLGVYLTWAPRRGRRDAERNCISNVRAEGLAYRDAARTLCHLVDAARRRRLTGVALKDERIRLQAASTSVGRNVLLD
jgi:ethanolamine ammonia-lyase small subunit